MTDCVQMATRGSRHLASGDQMQNYEGGCETVYKGKGIKVTLGFTSRYWVHWDAKPKRSGRDIRFYVPVKKDGT